MNTGNRLGGAKSLGDLRQLFTSLSAPESPTGTYRAEFVGPTWLRKLAPPALAIGGLAGWWGKEFAEPGRAVNLVRRGDTLARVLPMTVANRPSLLDGRPGITLSYPPGSPFPWPWIVDEVRRLEAEAFLCMTVVNVRWLPRLVFPFLLHLVGQKDS
jgi:hypothetical protein